MLLEGSYCNSLYHYSRLKTIAVKVGDIAIGGNNPIRIQSMTTTDTMNTEATVAQSIRMIEAGCELVRITAPSINEARNLENIKSSLRKKGYHTPIIADIHFTPNAAEMAARLVEKVRINPGNFADKKKFETISYNDESYLAELSRIRDRFIPLIKICKEYGTAMRIGTNHGSLSDRILSRYGDTPTGMVESALEFLRICKDENYHQIVLSMKASNAQVMVQAYRLLIKRMQEEEMYYPLHLGVTEAGDGEDGRIKSAAGIGTLLEDGIGDTVRVSLTEDPEFEIPVAKALVARYQKRQLDNDVIIQPSKINYNPFEYKRNTTTSITNIGGKQVPRVIADYSKKESINQASLFGIGYQYSISLDKWHIQDQAADFIYTGKSCINFALPGTLSVIQDSAFWNHELERHYPLFTLKEFISANKISETINFIGIGLEEIPDLKNIEKSNFEKVVFVLSTNHSHGMACQRSGFNLLAEIGYQNPLIIRRSYNDEIAEAIQLYATTDVGALLLDGFGDGVWITGNDQINFKDINSLSFGILQATRTRISKTEYISCPSCGRTLFDLQETTAKIRSVTDHLKGVKIGIMGCIVNGPGEMADADYGYVGTGPGKITLYKGKEVVARNIDETRAVASLIALIKTHGDWVDKAEILN
ncbi:MAG: 4-hydroxy-3-methylbut-2-en-yl diphosphate synthase [Bacteroidota bacterium]|jgi:(E)-4-hydroxy-3-methylbut-2-enyl-diphosphate synthase